MNITGQNLGQYRILEPIGQGGMASIYRAYQPTLQRFVAIKVLLTRHAVTSGFSDRFLREARAIAQLNHPNILPILDFGQESEFSYIITKLVTGGTLRERLGNAMNLSEATRIIEQIAAALDHAHSRGILHRDVKPSNVLLDEGDWVQLADFGLAKMLAGDKSLTASGVGIGTPAYMSPEQGQGLQVDHRTDIYSLGVILYEMITGRLPYHAETPMAIIFKHIYEPLTLPRLVRPDIPPLVESVILKALEKKPENRYAAAGEMAQALREAVQISELDTSAALERLTSPVDDASTQPTLALDDEEGDIAQRFFRAKPSDLMPTYEITPPPDPPRPPEVVGFVGRETELSYFSKKLETLNLAIITGMAGVGKTTLATKLIQRTGDPDRTFWHSFHESEGVEAVIWKLAGFLFWRGQEDLWRMLQGSQQNGGQHPPTEILLDYLFQMVRGQGYLLCLDDLHYVNDDPLLAELVERLHQGVVTKELSLVITSRSAPEFVPTIDFTPLFGLSADDTRALLTGRGLLLPHELIDNLFTQTEGNAQLLTLAIEALKQTQHPERMIAHLIETDDIERYLMAEVDAGLTDDEREVMSAVAVLLGYPGTRDAIEIVLDSGSVRRIVSDLSNRHLLSVSLYEGGKEYVQHAMVRAFYYDLAGRRERQEMHHRAGQYYETEEHDALRAALHYERAGKYEQAARLATDDVWALINQGQAWALRRLLRRFTARQLNPELWVKVNIACGQVYALLGEGQLARDSYEEALLALIPESGNGTQLTALSDSSAVYKLRAQACRGMAELLEHGSPQDALDWLHCGLNDLAGADILLEAWLYLKIGSVQIALGDYAMALSAVQKGLDLLPEGPSWLRAGALTNLGNIYYYQGDVQRASDYWLQGLEISQQLHDHFLTLVLLGNLGFAKEVTGDWESAITHYQQALDLAERLGSIVEQARIQNSLAILYTKQGDVEQAADCLSRSLDLAHSHNLKEHMVYILHAVADLKIRLEEWGAARILLDEAEQLALKMDTKYVLPLIYRGWTQVELAKENIQTALNFAEQSVHLTRDLGLGLEEGPGLRVLGQALWADGKHAKALEAFKDSVNALGEEDPYEDACTKMTWGDYLVSDGSPDQGLALLQEARATFQQLGAKRDLAAVDHILNTTG